MATRALHILLVEDNPADARLFELLFERSGGADGGPAIIQRAETLGAALHTLGTAPPCDVVLLDLTLPDSEGLDTLRALRERFPALPIVVLSGLSDQTIALRSPAHPFIRHGRWHCVSQS